MKRFLPLLLVLTLALTLAVPASADEYGYAADGENIGIIGGADGPTYILVSVDPKAAATVSKEEREQNLKALGGVVGQVNVLLGDQCIAFTDAAPEVKNGRTMVPLRASLEAMGAKVDYDAGTKTAVVTGEKVSFTHVIGSDVITRSDGSTVKMDAASYVTPSNRTMVPLRFFSQVLGYDVFWDNDYRMAFLLDEETFVEKVDSRLTILNGYLTGNAKRFDASKNYKEDMTLSGTVKVIDSIKGNRSYPYSGKASVLLGKDGMSMSLSADLSRLAEYFEELAGEPLPEAFRAAVVKPELEAVYSDKLYYKSPLFDALMAGENGLQAVSGAWYATDAAMSFSDFWTSTYSGDENDTVGRTIYAAMKQGDANRFFESWEDKTALAYGVVGMFGDETFTKSGSSYKRHFDKEELAKLLTEAGMDAEAVPGFIADSGIEELSIDMTLRGDGSAEMKFVLAVEGGETTVCRIDFTLTGNNSRAAVKGTVQVRNVCDVTFDAMVSLRATSEKPLAVPPAGTTVIALPTERQTAA